MSDIIVSRIQNRRGDLVNLPQPLQPGELGWATDTKQLFIGADPDDAPIGVQVYPGEISSAQTMIDTQIILIDVIPSFDVSVLRANLIAHVPEELILYDDDVTAHVGLSPAQAASPSTIKSIIDGTTGVNSSVVGLGEIISPAGEFGGSFPTHASANNVAAIMNILSDPIPIATTKLNIEILLKPDEIGLLEEILPSVDFDLPPSGTFVDFPGGLEYTTSQSESFIIEYSAMMQSPLEVFNGVGTMNVVSSIVTSFATLTNEFNEYRTPSVVGDLDFQAVYMLPNIVKIQYRNTLPNTVSVNVTNRRLNTFESLMSEWNNLTSDGKISKWRAFREENKDKEKKQFLNEVAVFFSNVPISSRYIDYYNPLSWPDPWEILCNSMFCVNGISILIYYTVVLCGVDNVKLLLVDDMEDRYLLVLVDDVHLLNYALNEVYDYTSAKNNFKILDTYTKNDIKQVY